MEPHPIKNPNLSVLDSGIEFHRNGKVLRFRAQPLLDEFMKWQLQAREAIFEQMGRGKHPISFGAHLPVVATMSDSEPFSIHTANKGAGFVPEPSVLQQYVEQYEDCLGRSQTMPLEESRAERIEVVRSFYRNVEDIDRRCFGLLEIFTGKTFDNIRKNPFVTLHFTDSGPLYRSYQINCIAEVILPDSLYYRFIYASRHLFEQERFHIQQPRYPFGYLFWVQQVHEKTPRQKISGRLMVGSSDLPLSQPPLTNLQREIGTLREDPGKNGKGCPVHVKKMMTLLSTDHAPRFKKILLPVDNSKPSKQAIDVAIAIGRKFNAEVVGIHVYAARLHDRRFVEMEDGLPEKYQQPEVLKKQRDIHDSLITKGLRIISDSYLDILEKKCQEHGVCFSRREVEGKNYKELVRAIHEQRFDLVAMGLTGLGETEKEVVGSVCLRVIRRIKTDCLLIKKGVEMGGRIMVAVDGSPQSFGGLKTALVLGKEFCTPVEAVAAFDPDFHVTAFRSLEEVLSDEAGKVFRFKEQERLHEEIINKGIAKIYRDHLETARKVAAEEGMQIETKLLTGKPYCAIIDYLYKNPASLLIVGRIGIHADEELDIGSTTENLLRLAPCNILISSRVYSPEGETQREKEMMRLPWEEEALVRLQNVPEFARAMAKSAIEEYAKSQGHEIVTVEAMLEAKEKFGG